MYIYRKKQKPCIQAGQQDSRSSVRCCSACMLRLGWQRPGLPAASSTTVTLQKIACNFKMVPFRRTVPYPWGSSEMITKTTPIHVLWTPKAGIAYILGAPGYEEPPFWCHVGFPECKRLQALACMCNWLTRAAYFWKAKRAWVLCERSLTY